jgi:hypothetical protein
MGKCDGIIQYKEKAILGKKIVQKRILIKNLERRR